MDLKNNTFPSPEKEKKIPKLIVSNIANIVSPHRRRTASVIYGHQ